MFLFECVVCARSRLSSRCWSDALLWWSSVAAVPLP